MTLVVDASVVAAALVDMGDAGRWAEDVCIAQQLVAPHLMPVEVASTYRRLVRSGQVSADTAALALGDLSVLGVTLHAFDVFADRIWELRENVSSYDAWYVALAEGIDAPLATLDRRLAQASGPRCEFLLPPD